MATENFMIGKGRGSKLLEGFSRIDSPELFLVLHARDDQNRENRKTTIIDRGCAFYMCYLGSWMITYFKISPSLDR